MGADAYCEVMYTKEAERWALTLGEGWTGKAMQWIGGAWGVRLEHTSGMKVVDQIDGGFLAMFNAVACCGETPPEAVAALAQRLAQIAADSAAVVAAIPKEASA